MRSWRGSWLWIPALAPLGRNEGKLTDTPPSRERRIVRGGLWLAALNARSICSNRRPRGACDGRPDRLARPKRRLLTTEETYVFRELFCFSPATLVKHRHRRRADDSRCMPPRSLRRGRRRHSDITL